MPEPSRTTVTATSVSLVVRLMVARRIGIWPLARCRSGDAAASSKECALWPSFSRHVAKAPTCKPPRYPIDRSQLLGVNTEEPMPNPSEPPLSAWHATTVLLVRKADRTVIGADGQVSLGQTIIKA